MQSAGSAASEKLTSIRDQHVAALQENFTEGHASPPAPLPSSCPPEPQHSNENQFIADYTAKLTEMQNREDAW